MVLIHRTRKPSAFHPPGSPENNTPDHNGQDTQDEQKPPQDIRPPGEQPEDEKGSSGDESPLISESRQGQSREEVFPVGEPFKPRRFILKKDRMERQASGRRTKTKFSGKGGRYVKSVLKRRDNDVAVDATLRAAAPWQKWRGRRTNLIIEKEDLRYRQRERTMGHLVIFVLDCSGSMGVKKRMIETKGAVMSLLVDCYHKKDKVSVIAFRKNAADLVLPPTSSVQLASRLLQDLPAGGKTPLQPHCSRPISSSGRQPQGTLMRDVSPSSSPMVEPTRPFEPSPYGKKSPTAQGNSHVSEMPTMSS